MIVMQAVRDNLIWGNRSKAESGKLLRTILGLGIQQRVVWCEVLFHDMEARFLAWVVHRNMT